MRKWRTTLLGLIAVLGATMTGCWQETKPPENASPSFRGVTVKVGALDEASLLAGVTAHGGEWKASREGAIAIREQPVTLGTATEVDVLLFPGDRLGDLIDADLQAAIPNEAVMPPVREATVPGEPSRSAETAGEAKPAEDPYDFMGVAAPYRDQVTRYGNERMALPYGGSALVLVYRRDAFEREANRTAAADKGIKLEPPKTWGQLDALAQFFQGRDWDGDGQADHGISLVLGVDPEGLGNATFLARSASLGQHPDQFSFLFDSDKMAPRIDAEPFVEALGGLIALKAAGPPKLETFDAAAARQAFRTGKVAMLIDRAERAASWSHGKPVGVAALPGSERLFDPASRTWTTPPQRNAPSYLPHGGGWLVGVRKGLSGTPLDAAIDLAKYLSNPDKSDRIRAERAFPMLPFRAAQMGEGLPDPASSPDVDTRLWSEAVGRTFAAAQTVVGLRIPGADDYLAELAEGRAAALGGTAP
ncbi:MAG TPA: extracellular solute-binding protein, partial [Isosphaeraceae bacterium]|nr:extracellular solute-binding protein [Isosphaeraceae bacterium]